MKINVSKVFFLEKNLYITKVNFSQKVNDIKLTTYLKANCLEGKLTGRLTARKTNCREG